MKSVKLTNDSIVRVYRLLDKLNFKREASRGKTKFQKRLQEKEEEYIAEKAEIQKKYIQLDEEGNFVILEDGKSSPLREELTEKDKVAFVESLDELENDLFEISFSEYGKKFKAMFDELYSLDVELSGEDATAYDELLDAYEENDIDKEEEK